MRLRKLVCDSGSSGTAGSVSDTSARQHVGSVFFFCARAKAVNLMALATDCFVRASGL